MTLDEDITQLKELSELGNDIIRVVTKNGHHTEMRNKSAFAWKFSSLSKHVKEHIDYIIDHEYHYPSDAVDSTLQLLLNYHNL